MEAENATVKNAASKFSIKKLGSARVFIVEYVISLWMLGGVLTGICVLFGMIVDHFADTNNFGLFGGSNLPLTVATLTALVVALPAYVVLTVRSSAAAAEHPSVMTTKWYMFFRNLFFVIIALSTLSAFTTIVYTLISHLVTIGLGEETKLPWATYLKSSFTTLFLWYVGYFYYRRVVKEGK